MGAVHPPTDKPAHDGAGVPRHCLSPSTHDCAPAGFRGHNLLAHFMIISAPALTQLTDQVLHLRFAEGERFLKLIATRTVINQLGVQFIRDAGGRRSSARCRRERQYPVIRAANR